MGFFSKYFKIENEGISHTVLVEQVGESVKFTYFQEDIQIDQLTLNETGDAGLEGNILK